MNAATEFDHHPGVVAVGCPLRITVSSRRTDGGTGGYACSATGAHCLPGDQCDGLRQQQERMAAILEAQAARPRGISIVRKERG